jgi:hypothetical protein
MRVLTAALVISLLVISCAEKKDFEKVDYSEYERCMDSVALFDRCANPGTSCEFHAKKVSVMLEESGLDQGQRNFIVRTCYRICSDRKAYYSKVRPKLISDCKKILRTGG